MLELGVVLVIVILAIAILLPRLGRTRDGARHIKDASQIRGLMQGMIVWAQNNKDDYPLPSRIDLNNTTTAEAGAAKDHSANVWSLMVFNGFVPVDLLVSPAEANGNIMPDADYQFSSPPRAVKPHDALWDPAFSVDFTSGMGAVSYAHNQPSASRISNTRWSSTSNQTEVVLGNRGPQVTGVAINGTRATTTVAHANSNTYLIHGGRTTWEGNIAFSDGNVEFLPDYVWSGMNPKPSYTTTSGARQIDIPFFDEPDDAEGTNAFLGVFTTAGDAPADWTAIWD